MYKKFPFQFNLYGHISSTTYDLHIQEMLEQILFTSPGERVNRPDFGCGVELMVFGSTSPEILSVKQTQINSQIQKWLGHLIQVLEVKITTNENRVEILIRYMIYQNQQETTQVFSR